MKANKYNFLIWQFNALLDKKEYDVITVDEVKRHARDETIPAFLKDKFGKNIDLSLFSSDALKELSEEWFSFENAIDEQRKFGVYNKGLCLLLAYSLESYQQIVRKKKVA